MSDKMKTMMIKMTMTIMTTKTMMKKWVRKR